MGVPRSIQTLVSSWIFLLSRYELRRAVLSVQFLFSYRSFSCRRAGSASRFYRYQAIAITDECSVAGVVKAYSTIQQHKLDIKQIVGSMFWLNDECQVVLLCPCRKAYAELCRIITNARRRSEKGSYQLSEWDLMSIRHCFVLWLPTHQNSDHYWGRWLNQHHPNRLWVAIQRHLGGDDSAYTNHCEKLAHELQLPITACGGVLMHSVERLPLQHVLTAVKHGCSVDKLGFERLSNAERALRPLSKIARVYKPKWLAESQHIANLCEFKLSDLKYEYPAELIPDGYTPDSYLRMLVERGKKRRFPEGVPETIQQTIENELALIKELKYHYYFLTIHDIVMFAKSKAFSTRDAALRQTQSCAIAWKSPPWIQGKSRYYSNVLSAKNEMSRQILMSILSTSDGKKSFNTSIRNMVVSEQLWLQP